MMARTIVFVLLIKLCAIECVMEVDLLNRRPTYLEAKVGSYAIFNCPLDFPQEIEIPYILHWNKEVGVRWSWQTKPICRGMCVCERDVRAVPNSVRIWILIVQLMPLFGPQNQPNRFK